jgi:hypothetical protein
MLILALIPITFYTLLLKLLDHYRNISVSPGIPETYAFIPEDIHDLEERPSFRQ